MTVSTITTRANYIGDAIVTQFSFGFKVLDDAHMYPYLDGVVQGSGFTVTRNADQEASPGGVVDFSVAPGDTVAVTLERIVPNTQGTDYTEYDPFPAETHETALDVLTMQSQQNTDAISRAIVASVTDDGTVDYSLPVAEALKTFRWNAAGTALENTDDPAVSADAAEASAAAALVSENAAAADATQVAADLVATNQDTIDTAADLVDTNADVTYSAEWANKAEDSLVSAAAGGDEVDDYSAKHFSNKAAASAIVADLAASKNMVAARNKVQNQDALSQAELTRTGFSAAIYTGNGTTQSVVTDVDGATGDFGALVWIKSRGATRSHMLYDTVRGTGKVSRTNLTAAEITSATTLTSFDTTGFSLGTDSDVNTNLDTFVSWSFQTTAKNYSSLGASLVIGDDSTFDTATGSWSPTNATLSNVSNTLRVTNSTTATGKATLPVTTVVGTVYRFTTDWLGGTASQTRLLVGTTAGGNDIIDQTFTGAGEVFVNFVAEGTTTHITVLTNSSTSGHYTDWDNIVVKEMVGAVPTNRGKPYESHYNPDMNFSIVGYEGDGVDGHEIPHHLGVTPELTIWKSRDTVIQWNVQSPLFGLSDYLVLNTTAAIASSASLNTIFSDTSLKLGVHGIYNGSADNVIAYNFASKSGVCKIGKYIGTGAAGNYVPTEVDGGDAFKPSFVMVKNLTAADNWIMVDAARGDEQLLAEASNAAVAVDNFDFVDTGFTCKFTGATVNALNNEYIFMAFAETSTDATKAWSDYPYATSATTIAIENNTLVSVANGFNANGQVDTQYEFTGSQTLAFGVGHESKHAFIYTNKIGTLGYSEVKPLSGITRNDCDKYGVISPSNPALRTTDKHFDYESASGVVLASGEFSTQAAYRAFNKDSNDIMGSSVWTIDTTTASWLQYKHTEKRILKSWRMREGESNTQTPKRFTIEGSNDGLNWTAIDSTYTSSDWTLGGAKLWGGLESTSGNSTAYHYHRINITANNGDATYTAIGELEFNTISAADYHLVGEGITYDSTDTPIERMYLGETKTDSNGNIIADTLINYPVAEQEMVAAKVHQDLTVYGEIHNEQQCTAWVNFDGTQNPPLIRDSFNVKDVVDLGVGQYIVIFETPMDNTSYSTIALVDNYFWGGVITTSGASSITTNSVGVTAFQKDVSNYGDSVVTSVMVFGGKKIK